jgi:tetratricopeptide (TPR) repeat protein
MAAFPQNVQHVLAIADNAATMCSAGDEEQKKAAWLYHEAGLGYSYSGQYKKALEWYNKALAILEKVLGLQHSHAIRVKENIAMAKKACGLE